jgi:hypothetical protein
MTENKSFLVSESAQFVLSGVCPVCTPVQGTPLPPPPRYIGIMELAAKCVFIYGLQQVTGKILMSKNLGDKKRGSDYFGCTTM